MPDRVFRLAIVPLVGLAILGAIAAIASVASRLRTVERTELAARGDPVMRLDPARATALRLSTGGEEIRLERAAAGWHVVAPVHADADPALVAGLLADLAALERRATVAPAGESAERLRPYGLDAPRTRIEIALAGGGVERLALGGDTGADGASFAMATGGEVVMVSSAARAGLEKRLDALRALAPATAREEPPGSRRPPAPPRRGG